MSVLPIVDRELRVAARRAGTYRLRSVAASGMLAVWVIILLMGHNSPTVLGQQLLNALGVLVFAFSLLAGVFLTSDCLSEEKREGTLGLLFLTDLKAYDVVLGKLAANSLHAFFGLLAVLPVFGLAVLAGGVTGGEFCRLSLVFVVTLFFSLSIGMAVSSLSSEAKQAATHACLVVGVLTGIFPALWWVQWSLLRWPSLDFLLWPSPAFAYAQGFDLRYRTWSGAHDFWLSLGTVFALGCAGIVLANVVLPRSWREGITGRAKPPTTPGQHTVAGLSRSVGIAEPMYWLAVRDASPQRMARRVLIWLMPVWLLTLIASLTIKPHPQGFMTALFTVYGLHLIVKTLMASEATRRFNQDRRSGALELLLATPVQVEVILDGHARALRRHFQWAITALCAVNFAMLLATFGFDHLLEMNAFAKIMFTGIFAGGGVMLFLDFYALSWVGMWRGLKARKHHRAILETLAQIILPPLAIVFFLIFLEPTFNGNVAPVLILYSWFAIGILIDFISAQAARRRLVKEFRVSVLDRFDQ